MSGIHVPPVAYLDFSRGYGSIILIVTQYSYNMILENIFADRKIYEKELPAIPMKIPRPKIAKNATKTMTNSRLCIV
jgi:hypothetical protein